MAVIGLDLGYQTSLIAAPRGGGIDVLLNDYTQRQTASLVSFTDKQRILGESARTKFITNFRNTIGGFKRIIGRKYKDADVQDEISRWGFAHSELPDGTVGITVNFLGNERVLSVVQVVAMFLVKLREFGESNLKTKVPSGVIGVPVWFSDAQRHALLDACRVANFGCLKLFNETSAVALTYGIYKQDLPAETETPRRVVFVDFGHSQIQMSACEFVKGKLTVLGTSCNPNLGGRSFDLLLVDHFAKVFKDKYKLDVKANKRACVRLEQECEKLRKQMSSYAQALPINIECFMEDKDVSGKMGREEFEQLAAPVFAAVEAVAQNLVAQLEALGVKTADLYAVEVVGGTSRTPAVKALIARIFGKEVSTTLNLDEAVARGCALNGAIISPTFRVREFAVHEKTPYGVQLAWAGKAPEEKGDTLEVYPPNSATHPSKMLSLNRGAPFEFTASYKDAAVVPGAEALIGSFLVEGVTPSFDGESQKVKIKVKVDEHGCFAVDSATLMDKLPPAADEKPADAAASPATPAAADAAGDSKPMDTGDAEEAEAPAAAAATASATSDSKDEQPKKKAKTHKSVLLNVVPRVSSLLPAARVQELLEEELEMQSQDRREVEKSIARNALEEYIYDMRDKIGSMYDEFIKPEEKEKFSSKLDNTLSWLSEDVEDDSKSLYVEKLNELRGTSKPVEARHNEAQQRPEAEQALREAIARARRFVDLARSGDEAYTHIDAKNIEKVAAELAAREAWIDEKIAQQRQLAKYDPPVVNASAIVQQREEFERIAVPIMNTPKPKVEPPKPEAAKPEAPKEEKKEEAKPAPAAEKKEEGPATPDAMDLD